MATVPSAATYTAGARWKASDVNQLTNTDKSFFLAPPFCDLTATTATTTLAAAGTVIAFDNEVADTDGMHDNVTNNSRITIQTAGLYLVQGGYVVSPTAATLLRVGIQIDGTLIASGYVGQTSGTSGFHGMTISRLIRLNAGSYVQLWGATGAGLATSTTASVRPWFQARWMSA